MSDVKKSGKMTVFRTDRHEDFAAMGMVGLLVAIVLVYMAFIVPSIDVKAPQDGKLTAVAVAENAVVKKGDALYTLEFKEKKYVQGALQEKVVAKEIKSKADGTVLKVAAKAGDEVKKDKQTILVLDHVKGTLP
jgi:hypothetical protein